MVVILVYWDKEIATQVVDLSKEYEDLFSLIVSKMKGIVGSLKEIKI